MPRGEDSFGGVHKEGLEGEDSFGGVDKEGLEGRTRLVVLTKKA